MEPKDVKPGDVLYIESSFYIDHGEDDVQGGKATVDRVLYKPIPANPVNEYMVTFREVPGVQYNLTMLLRQQTKLASEYKDQWAHPDPDFGVPLDTRL
jgi:hypothetical protein